MILKIQEFEIYTLLIRLRKQCCYGINWSGLHEGQSGKNLFTLEVYVFSDLTNLRIYSKDRFAEYAEEGTYAELFVIVKIENNLNAHQ